ncbi:MAG: peptidase M50 [Methanomicrobiales archaeon HGW-Methanomicrobiales-3]|jgi:membrane-associated protease RseP (regulator of RpoE activity)|nr:MAG: peptidase M50 [Methanomicrobiales archaeon HGW-Methanomicrobiales-3]
MDWILLIALLVIAYALAAFIIHKKSLWQDHITFYGPLMAVKTDRIGFFDRAIPFSRFLRVYGTIGVVMVVLVSVLMTLMLIISILHIMVQQPELTMANDPKNVLAIPGVNDFIPFTFAVWFGLLVTMVVHEFGHAILCRVEGIRVKSMGILLAVIPIGAFVEPDEEDQERSTGLPKMRMFGAGITNNILAGILCFALMIALLGFAVPINTPLVKAVYVDNPAHLAGIPPNSIIKEVNGVLISDRADVTAVLDKTVPGDRIPVIVEHKGVATEYQLTLAAWPAEMSDKTSGFMGVSYYDAPLVKEQFGLLSTPLGVIILLATPIYTIMEPVSWGHFGLLTIDSVDSTMWEVPFAGFWFVIQILFWCGWFNFVVGTFNALPLIPLDGGYILKEGIERLMDRRGWLQYAGSVVSAISYGMLAILLAVVILPILLNWKW